MKRLTIFTPTFNRAYILPKLYDSLCEQTCQDFEWLLVDDGSTDQTKELVEGWINEKKILIRYVCQENGGKMRAFNKAVSLTKTELFVCIDSDDQLASELVVKDSLTLSHGSLHDICSNCKGETTIFLLNEILRHYPYPSFEGELFITDVYIYDRMDEDFCFLFHPYISQKCDYHTDGYTMSYRRLLFMNPRGHREYHAQRIRLHKEGMVKSVICYISLSLFIRDKTMFSSSPNLIMTVLLYPLGCLKYLYDRYKLFVE